METVYLDNNATTRPLPEVVDAVAEALTVHWHNPSSMHRPGQAARRQIELARESVARLVGARPRQVVFTSGATESINLAIRGVLTASRPERRTVISSPVEHEAVRDLCAALPEDLAGARAVMLPVNAGGVIDADALEQALDPSVALVSVQWANNETGAVQPVARIAEVCRERGVLFHCDATQWVGKMPTDFAGSGIDLLSFSAHKMHGPKGVGALVVGPRARLRPLVRGVQEQERRGGTENAPGILGMGVAAEHALRWLSDEGERERLAALRDRFERAVLSRVAESSVNGPAAPDARLWNTTNIAFPRLEAEALLLLLSERGVCASAGAACSSGSLDPSPVLLAMGVPPERAHGSLRFSLSRFTTNEEIDLAIEVIPRCVERLRASAGSLA